MTIVKHQKRVHGLKEELLDDAPLLNDVGGWVELGRTTLGSAGDTISVGSLSDKRYYMILGNNFPTGGWSRANLRFNSDSGSNYANRYSSNGAADGTQTSLTFNTMENADGVTSPNFNLSYIANLSNKEKLHITHSVTQNTSGSGTAPNRFEICGKWSNTSNPISTIAEINDGTGDFDTGSEVVVLGWDPDDTHTNNFWEELGSHELSSESNQLDVSGMTAKKYLWYQAFIKKDATASNFAEHSINGITTGGTWARRISSDGGADGTATSQNTINTTDSGAGGYFLNGFVINNSGQEKLFIEHVNQNTTAGAGTAPNRKEAVLKSTTSAQITQLTISGATNGYEAGSILKVWGAD